MKNNELSHWAAVYNRLDERHSLFNIGVTFDTFIGNPEFYNHWIIVYFANPALFTSRENGAAVLLATFLEDPDLILISCLEARQCERRLSFASQLDLLPKQSVAAAMSLWSDSDAGKHSQWRGGRFVQSLKKHGHVCVGKWKTKRGVKPWAG